MTVTPPILPVMNCFSPPPLLLAPTDVSVSFESRTIYRRDGGGDAKRFVENRIEKCALE